jgi:hypothetical protein
MLEPDSDRVRAALTLACNRGLGMASAQLDLPNRSPCGVKLVF